MAALRGPGASPWALFASFLARQKGGPPEGQTSFSHQSQPNPRMKTQRWDAQRATAYKKAVRFQSGAEPSGCPAKGHPRPVRSKSVPLRGPVLKGNLYKSVSFIHRVKQTALGKARSGRVRSLRRKQTAKEKPALRTKAHFQARDRFLIGSFWGVSRLRADGLRPVLCKGRP